MRSILALLVTAVFWLGVCSGPAAAQIFELDSLFPDLPEVSKPVTEQATPPRNGDTLSPEVFGVSNDDDGPMLGTASTVVEDFRKKLMNKLRKVPSVGAEILATLERASPTGKPSYFLVVGLFCTLLLMIGRGVNWIYGAFIARPLFVLAQRPNPKGYLDKLPVLAYRVLLSAIGVILTVGIAVGVGLFFYQNDEPTLVTTITVFVAYSLFMMVDIVWRMTLSPFLPEYRLISIRDRAARRLYGWLAGISMLGIGGIALSEWLEALGLPADARMAMIILLDLALAIAVIMMIRVNRAAIDDIILAGRTPATSSWLTLIALRIWAPLTVIYLIAAWGKLTWKSIMGIRIGDEAMIVPYLVLMAGLLAYATASYVIERIFTRQYRIDEANEAAEAAAARAEPDLSVTATSAGDSMDMDGDGDEEGGGSSVDLPPASAPMVRHEMRSFEDLARRIASLFALGAGAWVLVYYWGGSEIFAENAMLGIAEDVIDILLFGYIIYHAVRIWIDGKIEEEVGDEIDTGPLDGEGGGAGATRLATLLPLVRNFVLGMILIAIGLVAATELGVNVAPLFAGAGIIGLAIGFGSQTLVRDVLSGAFYLLDDAFRKGEYIDVGEVKGTVEKISVRSFQLRHHLGMLHTIPFGEIKFLTNFSRDWVMMKLPLRVTYDTDVDRVRKLIKKLGLELMEDPVVGPNFIQPLKSQGVIQMDDSAMIIRVKFMTKPGDQWVVRKRVYQEIRELFAREGIKFAHREVTVRIPDLPQGQELNEAEVKAIGAAARTAGDLATGPLQATGTTGRIDDR
ncbi:mechanosensitive ion channel family protein [Rhodobacteraceae bacterium NNCM2]|nr:mechanosensitive ion channel family protein [Coraliihabitans acroporae]